MRKYRAVLFVTSKARLRSTAACQSGSTCETSSRNSLLNVLDASSFACFAFAGAVVYAPAGLTTRRAVEPHLALLRDVRAGLVEVGARAIPR